MPSVNSSSVVIVCASSTVMTPSLPTLVNASPISCADGRRPAPRWSRRARSPARRRPACAALSSASLTASTAASMPRLSDVGLAPAATFLQPGVDQGLGQHGGGGGAVAGDVVGLGRDRLGQLGAEVLVRVVELDLAGDRDAVVGDDRRAERLVQDDVAALRAERDLDRVGQLVDAALERAAGVLVETEDLRHGVPSCLTVRRCGTDRTPRCRAQPNAPARCGGPGRSDRLTSR